MCCPNGSRKLLTQKIRLDRNIFVSELIFRTKCDFLQVLDLHIFRQLARLLMPVPLPFSPSNQIITWSISLFCEAFFYFKN
jgi:hypothetical protein